MNFSDTICALGTPAGEGALAVIRVSGPATPTLAQAIFCLERPPLPRVARLNRYRDRDGTVIDQVLWTFFAEKASYTGEAMMEISCHGNPFVVQKILADLMSRGCRCAEPGEFTRTAFLNGKIDLSQAEAVGEIIRARTDKALLAAQRQLEGALGVKIREMTDRLLQILAEVEAHIDFVEEDLPEDSQAVPSQRIENLMADLEVLGRTRRYHALLQEGARAVIFGAPNAGKSSLLNALLGEERALVSEEAGTTRDYIAERWHAGPYCIQLMDTAGVREGAGALESAGIARSLEKLEGADLCLWVIDTSLPFSLPPPRALAALVPEKTLIVLNKSDLQNVVDESVLPSGMPSVRISLRTGDGLEGLQRAIVKLLESNVVIPGEDQVIVSARHAAALDAACAYLDQALGQWHRKAPAEFVASDLRAALESLGDIVGRPDHEALLDKLFGTFCIGK